MTPTVAFVGLGLVYGASFFFALAESSLFSLSKWQVRQLEEKGSGPGKVVSQLLAQPQDLLATIVLGNSFANASVIAISLWIVFHLGWPLMWSMAGVALLILFGAEVAPKTLAVRAPDLWSLRVARPMQFLQKFSLPFRQVAQHVVRAVLRSDAKAGNRPQSGLSDAEYQELLEMAFQQGALAAAEKEIILQIISLDRRQAKDVMKPRSQMACIPDDLTMEEMVEAARRYKHRRLPMYDETPDTIVGVLNTRALLLDPNEDLANAIEFPSFVPESMNLLQLLKSFQRQQRGLAIVLDEFGSTAGIVTLEDILEEVVGELRTEKSRHGFVMEKLSPGSWRVSGAMRMDDFRREYPQLPEVPGIETMGGLVIHQLEVVPAPGDEVIFDGLRLKVTSTNERCVLELLVEVKKR